MSHIGSATSSADSSGGEHVHGYGEPNRGQMHGHQASEEQHLLPAVPVITDIRETVSIITHNASSFTLPQDSTAIDGDHAESENTTSAAAMSSRAYQLEMLEQSLRQNVIVAMDTGSGKTQVAVLRIKSELETCDPEKIIWFLAPTVSLCAQQVQVLQLQVASTPIKLITGNDNVHTWSAKIWTAILEDVRVVVSTYQVLLDALSHAFITMDRLALIVFDEAHNCTGKHPGSKIMTDFYHQQRPSGGNVPAILGLTATPSIRSVVEGLEDLESILDARCISPTLHREELLNCVKKPQISYATYNPPGLVEYTPSMQALHNAYVNLDITRDPYVLGLLADPTERNQRTLAKTLEKYDTYSQNQMKGLCSRAVDVCQQLGPWAADLYLWKAITAFLDRVDASNNFLDKWLDEEKLYLSEVLRQVCPTRPPARPRGSYDISDKVTVLLHELLDAANKSVVGIVFARERATVAMLCEVLSSSPRILEKYRIGAMIGTSNSQSRTKAVYEILEDADLKALQNFQSGKVSLLIATAVLEEGIDVPACNLVVCFDSPATPKSFIQRRGRARMKESRLILLTEHSSALLDHWEALEREMTEAYQDEEREVRKLELLEESESIDSTFFVIEATGARLDFDNAKQHLEHFCRILSQGEFVDSRPDYIIHSIWEGSQQTLRCTVLLPAFLPVDLRQIDSASAWLSEKNATKDAAFQAYRAFHKAGLINDNMLPFRFDEIPGVENRHAAEIFVEPPLNPWHDVCRAWKADDDKWLYNISCRNQDGQSTGRYSIILPTQVDLLQTIRLYISEVEEIQVKFSMGRSITHTEAMCTPDHTSTLLALHFAHRWQVDERSHVVRVVDLNATLSMHQIGCWPFNPYDDKVKGGQYLIRDPSRTPFTYDGLLPFRPPIELVKSPFADYDKAPVHVPYLVLSKLTKRSDFLHKVHLDVTKAPISDKPYDRVLPIPWAAVDDIPARHARFGMLIPPLIHEVEVMLVAKELATTLLKPVGIKDLTLVREAISARSSCEPMDYERLEFLGDSILKYCASIQASVENPTWPEGYLSFFKDRLVSNSRLSRAAIEKGLAKFILTKPFTGQKWRPLYADDVLRDNTPPSPGRKLSTKTLADVVEALIGASYKDGGVSRATKCIALFLDEKEWYEVSVGRTKLFDIAPDDDALPPVLAPLEGLIGYSFRKKSLLVEAMTHASYIMDTGKRSLERLEFLGDAILDNLIVTKLFSVNPPLPHHQMHMLKTAMVNADFLAFVGLEHQLHGTETIVTPDLEVTTKDTTCALWQFMRHASVAIGLEQQAMLQRFQEMRGDILTMMTTGTSYPWALLARLQAKKFFSDIFEALLGAIWIDSGSLEVCNKFLDRFQITAYLDRILRDGVNVQHPKEELGKWAVSQTVTYAIEIHDGLHGERKYGCKVHVGNRIVAEVEGGVSKDEVKTKAAEAAVRILTQEKEAAAGHI